MPKQTKVCRVCGATYEACRSIKPGNNVFNWREVACSPECGAEYFQRIAASRAGNTPSSTVEESTDVTSEVRVSKKKKSAKTSIDEFDIAVDVMEEDKIDSNNYGDEIDDRIIAIYEK